MCLCVSMLALFFVLLCCFSQFYWCCCGCLSLTDACVRVDFAVVRVCACSMVFWMGCFLGFRIGFMMFYLFALFVRFFS